MNGKAIDEKQINKLINRRGNPSTAATIFKVDSTDQEFQTSAGW
jgi:hypothetical protein